MPLTPDEAQLAADAYLVRQDETPDRDLWFAIDDWAMPEAHRLMERGYLSRRWCGADMVFRLTDEALTAQELSGLLHGAEGREN